MWIDDLIARCPRFSRVVLYKTTEPADMYHWAEPGDVVHLLERSKGQFTGRAVIALVVQGTHRDLNITFTAKPIRVPPTD